jgi:hypothetical protein
MSALAQQAVGKIGNMGIGLLADLLWWVRV